jgi:hypothetical protein
MWNKALQKQNLFHGHKAFFMSYCDNAERPAGAATSKRQCSRPTQRLKPEEAPEGLS